MKIRRAGKCKLKYVYPVIIYISPPANNRGYEPAARAAGDGNPRKFVFMAVMTLLMLFALIIRKDHL